MVGRVALLPDAGVDLVPAHGGGVGQVADEPPHVVVGRVSAAVPPPRQQHELTEHIVLALDGRRVTDSHGRRAAVARQRHLELDQPPLALDTVGDLEVVDVPRRASLDEAPERVGLVVEADVGERAHREGRVADPRVAVVPVTAAALDLGKRRRRRCHDRAGRARGQPFEHERRPQQRLTGRPVHRQARGAGPASPPPCCPLDERVEPLEIDRRAVGVELVRGHVAERERRALSGGERERRPQVMGAGRLDRRVRPDHERIVAANRDVAVWRIAPNPRPHLAIVEARGDLGAHPYAATTALDQPHQVPAAVRGSVAGECEQVGQLDLAGSCPHARPQDECAG